ncbi:MAG: hypothetical protein JWP16_1332 [Alphaproteobacteria bacterium]|nr:hypothetical protein [Alphaproteobacteria bacterium]MDB5740292.1 hypothetical protein [Alphaproteobacteria bacterium]
MERPDQLRRDELLEGRQRVALQLQELCPPEQYKGFRPNADAPLVARLRLILQEIDAELAELGS